MGYAAIPMLMQAAGGVLGGFAKQSTYNAQAQIARNNAIISAQNAKMAMAAGESESEQAGLRTRAQIADIKAKQAGNGLDVNTGSPVDVRASAAKLGMYDQLTIRANAAREAYGYERRSDQEMQQSKLYRQAAKFAPIEGLIGGSSSLLSGAANIQSQNAVWDRTAGSGGGSSLGNLGSITDDAGQAVWS